MKNKNYKKLYYKIEFNSSSNYFKEIVNDFIIEHGINANTRQYKDFILITCDDSKENIQSFFEFLEKNLPLSVFLGKSYVIDSFDESLEQLKECEEEKNFEILTDNKIENILENQNINKFVRSVQNLKNGQILSIRNDFDDMDLFLPSKLNRELYEKNNYEVNLIVCNVNKLQNLVQLSQKDIQLLFSIERPLVKLKFNNLQNNNKHFSQTSFINVKLPDSKELIELSMTLENEGIDFILYASRVENELKTISFGEQSMILSGDKAIFPMYDPISNKTYISSSNYFKKIGGVAKSAIINTNKNSNKVVGVYFSIKSDESSIFINSISNNIKEIISIPNIIVDIDNALEEISSYDENTEILIENYKNSFPEFFEKKLANKDANGFEAILDISAYILGMKDHKEFEETAHLYNSKNGIQLDMKLVKIDGINYLDYRSIIQSIMSFKMGDIDNKMLCYSFYESLSNLLKKHITKIANDLDTKDLVLCGDMFANPILMSKVQEELSKTFDISIPKNMPIDKA